VSKSNSAVVKVSLLEFHGRHIAEAGMQPLRIVHIVNKLRNIGFGLGKALVLVEIHLLSLELLEKLSALALSYGLPTADILICACTPSRRST
jgi:hypothetical protein